MRKIAVTLLPLLLIVLAFGVRYYRLSNELQAPVLPTVAAADPSPAIHLIEEVNRRNSMIRTFLCDNIDVTSSDTPLVRLKAILAYEKPSNIRMVMYSALGKEADLGSNKSHFWFWSHRMKPSVLYYTTHDKLYQTRLKTPFNPIWIRQSLGFEEIKLDRAYYSQNGNLWYLYAVDKNTLGSPVIRVIVLDAEKKCMVAQHIFENSHLVCSSEIKEFITYQGLYVPNTIVFTWYDENIQTTWKMNGALINTAFQEQAFALPSHEPKVNMADD